MKKSIPAIKQITMQVTRGESVPHHQQTIKKKNETKGKYDRTKTNLSLIWFSKH